MTEPYDSARHPLGSVAFSLEPSDPAFAGQAIYTPGTLRAYDAVVVKVSNSWVWRCPARRLVEHYDRHVTGSHLDVGPGSGYYLDHCRFPAQSPRVTLLDPNPDVLWFAGRRIRRYEPALHTADVLRPLHLEPAAFRSVALSYVLHCLPGDIDSKLVALDHLMPLVEPGGVVFGATILGPGVRHSQLGQLLLRVYNRRGVFCNTGDDLGGLERGLASRFGRYHLDVVGAVALFAGWVA